MIAVDVRDQCGDRGRAIVVEDGAENSAVLLAALAGGGDVVVFPLEERAEEGRVLGEETADVAILGTLDPVVVEAVVGFGGAGVVPTIKVFEVGAIETGPGEGEGANLEDFTDLEEVGHVLTGKRTNAPAAARHVFDDALGVETLKRIASEGAGDAEVGGGGFFAEECFLAAQAKAHSEGGKAGVEIVFGGVGRRERARRFRGAKGRAVGGGRRGGSSGSALGAFQHALAAQAGEGEADRLRAHLISLGESGEAEVERGVARGGKAATEIVGDVISQRHFEQAGCLILSTISRKLRWQAFFK